MQGEVPFNIGLWYDEVMINEIQAKKYCSENVSLIENYHQAIADKDRMWDIHHRRECDEEGRTLFTHKQLKEMNLYFKRPASELVFVTKSMHKKIHHEQMQNCGKLGGKIAGKSPSRIAKISIPILQFTKDGEFIKEWPSVIEACRKLGIGSSSICQCCKGRCKQAGGYRWAYKDSK